VDLKEEEKNKDEKKEQEKEETKEEETKEEETDQNKVNDAEIVVDEESSKDELDKLEDLPKKVKVMYIEEEQKKVSQPLEFTIQQMIKTLSDTLFEKYKKRIDDIFRLKNEKELLLSITAQLESLY